MWTSKISRARTLKDSLQKDIDSFFVSRPYKISTKVDPQSRRLIYYLTDVIDVPEDIALLTGDIIQNLRSSLDHLAYELFTKNLGSLADGRHVYFPIADDLARYKDQIRKMTWLKQNAKDLLDTIKPYRGGNQNLWRIHKLNIIDKHRLLLVVGSLLDSVDVGACMLEKMHKNRGLSIPLFIKPADKLFPLKVGDELFIDGPGATPIPNMKFRFSVVLNEIDIIEGEPLLKALEFMISEAEQLVPKFQLVL